ncbi:phosphatidylinositol alpha-1,6-mannosyltransferase [Arthrobacter pascens]|uniref:glycosyltransferase family 4 protein n=1 Tax=Arthrobacter pascens TaxID=1677 RepID=UPI0027934A39|nr:glycosyltransferase family 4 protein [Arthrobacter pascens]MDQ0677970.1 phosphatidylinositol alpha-1,6-mannosyltransferase [Arthrobacter pascens]
MSLERAVKHAGLGHGNFVDYKAPAHETNASSFLSSTELLPAADVVRWLQELVAARRYDVARAIGEANYARFSELPEFLTALRAVYSKTGAVSLALRVSFDLARLGKTSPASMRVASGRLRELSGWIPQISGPVDEVPPMNSRRIMHLVKESRPFLSNGFVARSHANFLAEIEAGLEPHVVTEPGFARRHAGNNFRSSAPLDSVPHHHLDLGDIDYSALPVDRYLEMFAELAYQRLRIIRPSVIHVSSGRRGFETALVGLALKQKTGLPLVYEVRSFFEGNWTSEMEQESRGEVFQRRMAVEEMCMHAADFVLTLGASMRDELVGRGIPAEKIGLIPNGVDVGNFTPGPKPEKLVKSIALEDTFVFGYISNMDHYRESQETLVEALAIARSRGIEATLLLVGSGPRAKIVRQCAKDLGVAEHLRIVGHVDHQEIVDYYRLIDLFCVPRIPERAGKYVTPLKPFEAMACGVPVAVSDLPALREIVSETRGFTFAPGEAQAIVALLENAMAQPDRFRSVADEARAWVVTQRQWKFNGPRYAAAFEKARNREGISQC